MTSVFIKDAQRRDTERKPCEDEGTLECSLPQTVGPLEMPEAGKAKKNGPLESSV